MSDQDQKVGGEDGISGAPVRRREHRKLTEQVLGVGEG